jgi:hypothetical protein
MNFRWTFKHFSGVRCAIRSYGAKNGLKNIFWKQQCQEVRLLLLMDKYCLLKCINNLLKITGAIIYLYICDAVLAIKHVCLYRTLDVYFSFLFFSKYELMYLDNIKCCKLCNFVQIIQVEDTFVNTVFFFCNILFLQYWLSVMNLFFYL